MKTYNAICAKNSIIKYGWSYNNQFSFEFHGIEYVIKQESQREGRMLYVKTEPMTFLAFVPDSLVKNISYEDLDIDDEHSLEFHNFIENALRDVAADNESVQDYYVKHFSWKNRKVVRLSDFNKLNIQYQHLTYSLSDFLREGRKKGEPESTENIDFNVWLPKYNRNLQRDFVWTLPQKQEFIRSILMHRCIPPISIIYYDHKVFKIIDGKQRLSTLIDFYFNKFPLLIDGTEYYYRDFGWFAKYAISQFTFDVNLTYEYPDDMISDDDKIRWYMQINYAGTKQKTSFMNDLQNLLTDK